MSAYPVLDADGRHLGTVASLITGWSWVARLSDGRRPAGTAKSRERAENAVRAAHEAARKGGVTCRP